MQFSYRITFSFKYNIGLKCGCFNSSALNLSPEKQLKLYPRLHGIHIRIVDLLNKRKPAQNASAARTFNSAIM